MTKREQIRRGILTLLAEITKLYFDKDGNVKFQDLEEVDKLEKPKTITSTTPPPPQQIINVQHKTSIQSITKDVVIQKFEERTISGETWIESFEKECSRLGIDDHEFPQALRLFSTGPALNWYSTNLILLEDVS